MAMSFGPEGCQIAADGRSESWWNEGHKPEPTSEGLQDRCRGVSADFGQADGLSAAKAHQVDIRLRAHVADPIGLAKW